MSMTAGASPPPSEGHAQDGLQGPPPGPMRPERPFRAPDIGEVVEVRYRDEVWIVRRNQAKDRQKRLPAREKAVALGRSLAQEHGALLIIYDENDEVEEQQDHGAMGAPRPLPEPGARAAPEATPHPETQGRRVVR